MASRKSALFNTKPCSVDGRAESQFDAPFSLVCCTARRVAGESVASIDSIRSFATVLGRQGDQMRPLFVSSKTTNMDLLYQMSENKNATKSASPFEYSSSKFTASNIVQSQSQSAEIFSLEASLQLTEGGVCTTHNVKFERAR